MKAKTTNKEFALRLQLFDFLTSFLQDHNEHEININLICKEISISRNTFYYHYTNLNDVYADYLNYYKEKFISKTQDSNQDRIKQYYELYKDNFKIVTAYLKMTNYSLEKHVNFKKEFLLPYIFQDIEEFNDLDEEDKNFIAGGIITAEYYWAKEGFKEPIDDILVRIKRLVIK